MKKNKPIQLGLSAIIGLSMTKLLYKLYIYKSYNASKLSKSVLYSPLEKCTWRFKIDKMSNSNYILLYGVGLFGREIELNKFKDEIVNKGLDLWDDRNFVQGHGRRIYNQASKKKEFNGIDNVCNIYAVVVDKKSILDTLSKDLVVRVKSNENIDEVTILRNICRDKKLGAYKYPPKVRPIRKNSRLLEVIEPALYRIIDVKCILDVAIGEQEINNLIHKLNKETDDKLKIKKQENTSDNANKKVDDLLKPFDIFWSKRVNK